MPFTVDHPAALWLLLLAIPFLALGLRGLHVLDKPRRVTALALRLILLGLLVAMLAGLSTQQRHDDLTVLAVVDRSASIRTFGQLPTLPNPTTNNTATVNNPSPDQAILRFLEAAAADRRPDDSLGLITYDARPSLRARPGPRDQLQANTLDNPQTGTDSAAALAFALAGHNDADSALRLVLATDANETQGNLLELAKAAAAANVQIDVLPIPYLVGPEVMVESVDAPPQAREGQTVPVRVVLRGTQPAPGTLQLLRDGQLLDLHPDPQITGVPIQRSDWSNTNTNTNTNPDADADAKTMADNLTAANANTPPQHVLALTIDVPLNIAGPASFTAVFEPDPALAAAARRQNQPADLQINNRAQGFTQVQGKGKILLVNQTPGPSADILPNTLQQQGLELDVVAPRDFPTTLEQLQRYDAVLFQNVPADQIRPGQQRHLVRYVKELGGGFAMIGGPDSFGAGGWTNSAVDRDLLPVTCEIPSQTILPSGALVICIDRSGSMAIPVGATGRTQLELAAEAAIAAVQTLYPQDLVGLLAFDSNPTWIVPLAPNADPANTARLIRSIQPSGGTNISVGLARAYDALSSQRFSDTAVKHVILLTDGNEPANNYAQLLARFRAKDISITTVGVGDSQDQQLLQSIASLGNGTYHKIVDPLSLPQIFIKEARTIRKNLIREQPFTPQQVATGSPITAGINFNQPLAGLVLTGPRNDRRVETPLLGPQGEPLFATGQVGLGRVAAFTSDATNRWAAQWLEWNGYADFWTRTVRTLARPATTQNADLTTRFQGNQLQLTLNVYPDPDNPQAPPTRRVRGGVLTPDGTILPVTLQQTGPGRFQTTLPAPDDGNYLATLFLADDQANNTASVFGGASRPPGQELRNFQPNHALLQQIATLTGGRILNPADPTAQPLFARNQPFTTVSSRPLRWQLMPWLLLFLLLDIANRRIAWDAPAILAYAQNQFAPHRQTQPQRQTFQALKKRKTKPAPLEPSATTTTIPTPTAIDHTPPPPPTTKPPNPTPTAPPQTPPAPTDPPPTNSTTSRLLAAKRRANPDN